MATCTADTRAAALRAAAIITRTTETDALREVSALLAHAEHARATLEDGGSHPSAICDMCGRVAVWVIILEGAQAS